MILQADIGSKLTIQIVDAEKLRDNRYAGRGRCDFGNANTFGRLSCCIWTEEPFVMGKRRGHRGLGHSKKDGGVAKMMVDVETVVEVVECHYFGLVMEVEVRLWIDGLLDHGSKNGQVGEGSELV